MPTYRDAAICLRTHKLGESDRIVTLLTRRNGKVRAVAKAVRRVGSRFGARLEPFMFIDVQLHRGRSLDTITQVEVLGPYAAAIAGQYPRYTAAAAIAEVADKLTPVEREPSTQLFWLVAGALAALANGDHAPSLVLDAFLLRSMALAGYAPSFAECARCGADGPHRFFAPSAGGMVCPDCRPPGSAAPSPEAVALMGALLAGDWAAADASGEPARRESAGLAAAFAQWHMERAIRSLRLVERA